MGSHTGALLALSCKAFRRIECRRRTRTQLELDQDYITEITLWWYLSAETRTESGQINQPPSVSTDRPQSSNLIELRV